MRCRRALAVAAALMLAAGCSGDDAAGDSTTTTDAAPTSTTSSETTAPPATAPPSTVATTTTSGPPPDPTTSTSEPTTTTSDSRDDFAAQAVEVIERTEASWDAVLVAFADPFDEAKVVALAQYFTGNQLEGFKNLIEEFRAGNFRTVPNPNQPEVYDADPRSLTLRLEEGVATVQVCHVDTSLIVEEGGNPDGTDRIVSDDIEQEVVELDVVRVDGVWKVNSARSPETEIAQCP